MNRDQLISHYDEVMGAAHGYPDMDAYVARRETLYRRYCIGKSRGEEALVWMKLLPDDFGRDIANLGCYLALREDDASIFHLPSCTQYRFGLGPADDGERWMRS